MTTPTHMGRLRQEKMDDRPLIFKYLGQELHASYAYVYSWQKFKVVDIHLANGIESCTDWKQTLDDTSFF